MLTRYWTDSMTLLYNYICSQLNSGRGLLQVQDALFYVRAMIHTQILSAECLKGRKNLLAHEEIFTKMA